MIVRARVKHLAPIIADARQADVDECWAAGAVTFAKAIEFSFRGAEYVRTWQINGHPGAMAGVRSDGQIWLLGSNLVDKFPFQFLHDSRKGLKLAQRRYDYLHNFIDQRNSKFLKWLDWLGFKITGPFPYGRFGKPFFKFEWRREQ